MGLMVSPIVIEDEAWVRAFVRIGPGVRVSKLTVITIGSVVMKSWNPRHLFGESGTPGQRTKTPELIQGPPWQPRTRTEYQLLTSR